MSKQKTGVCGPSHTCILHRGKECTDIRLHSPCSPSKRCIYATHKSILISPPPPPTTTTTTTTTTTIIKLLFKISVTGILTKRCYAFNSRSRCGSVSPIELDNIFKTSCQMSMKGVCVCVCVCVYALVHACVCSFVFYYFVARGPCSHSCIQSSVMDIPTLLCCTLTS